MIYGTGRAPAPTQFPSSLTLAVIKMKSPRVWKLIHGGRCVTSAGAAGSHVLLPVPLPAPRGNSTGGVVWLQRFPCMGVMDGASDGPSPCVAITSAWSHPACSHPSSSPPAAGLVPSAPAAAGRSTPATGCGERGATPTTSPASPASPASASSPPVRSSAWWRRRCCAASTTTP